MHETKVVVDDNGNPVTYPAPGGEVVSSLNLIPDERASKTPTTLLAMTEAEKEAHLEFREAAREARATQEAAQRAAVRYANAVKRLSEVMAPPSLPTEGA